MLYVSNINVRQSSGTLQLRITAELWDTVSVRFKRLSSTPAKEEINTGMIILKPVGSLQIMRWEEKTYLTWILAGKRRSLRHLSALTHFIVYTSIPHDKLKDNIRNTVIELFEVRRVKYMCVTNAKATSLIPIESMVATIFFFSIGCYRAVQLFSGYKLQHIQWQGLQAIHWNPYGNKPRTFHSNIFLHVYENKYILSLILVVQFVANFKFANLKFANFFSRKNIQSSWFYTPSPPVSICTKI